MSSDEGFPVSLFSFMMFVFVGFCCADLAFFKMFELVLHICDFWFISNPKTFNPLEHSFAVESSKIQWILVSKPKLKVLHSPGSIIQNFTLIQRWLCKYLIHFFTYNFSDFKRNLICMILHGSEVLLSIRNLVFKEFSCHFVYFIVHFWSYHPSLRWLSIMSVSN